MNATDKKGNTVLMWVVDKGSASIEHANIVQELLQYGAEVNAVTHNGLTALMLASCSNYYNHSYNYFVEILRANS